jgi:hypothetical protein
LPPSQAKADTPINKASAELKINFFMVFCLIVWYKCKAPTKHILLVPSYCLVNDLLRGLRANLNA